MRGAALKFQLTAVCEKTTVNNFTNILNKDFEII
jgi:hypothetical protein